MAGGGFVTQGEIKRYNGRVTMFVIVTCMVAATGGLIFGYDIGVSGTCSTVNMSPTYVRAAYNMHACRFEMQGA